MNVQMKQKVEIILEETGYKESRAAKMDLNDILKYVRLPSPHEFADVSFADYCRPFMNLISISLECAIISRCPPPCINYFLFILHSFLTLVLRVLSTTRWMAKRPDLVVVAIPDVRFVGLSP
jgi:hypothetical protein